MTDLKIVYLAPDELTPYDRNVRVHSPTDIEQIKTSILREREKGLLMLQLRRRFQHGVQAGGVHGDRVLRD